MKPTSFIIGVCAAISAISAPVSPSTARDLQFFRIGTAEPATTYFPVGGVMANALSKPPGSRSCERGGACGVDGMVAVATATSGSVENIELIRNGRLEAALVQADVAFWAQTGTGPYEEKGKAVEGLRAIASLFPEHLHVVVPKQSKISSVEELSGHKVSLGQVGSGTHLNSKIILGAFGLKETDIQPAYLRSGLASDRIKINTLDAFFLVAGAPAPSVAELLLSDGGRLLSITGSPANRIVEENPFFYTSDLPEGAYGQYNRALTLAISALFVTHERQDPELIYEVTKALFRDRNLKMLQNAHYMGRRISLETAQDGVVIPFHEGALRYLREVGATR